MQMRAEEFSCYPAEGWQKLIFSDERDEHRFGPDVLHVDRPFRTACRRRSPIGKFMLVAGIEQDGLRCGASGSRNDHECRIARSSRFFGGYVAEISGCAARWSDRDSSLCARSEFPKRAILPADAEP